MKRPSMVNFVRLHSLWIESRDLRLSKGPTALQLQHRPSSLSVCPHLPLYTSATSDSHSQFRELVSQRATASLSHILQVFVEMSPWQARWYQNPFTLPVFGALPWLPFIFVFCFFTHHISLHLTCCREFKHHQGKPCFYLLLCPQSLSTATYTVKWVLDVFRNLNEPNARALMRAVHVFMNFTTRSRKQFLYSSSHTEQEMEVWTQ